MRSPTDEHIARRMRGISEAVYDRIGSGYARFRRPDPRIEAAISGGLATAHTIVNVGAGTGSYEPTGRTVVAVEPSEAMIAQRAAGAAPCIRADASALPFRDTSFDAGLALLTVHHWPDPISGLEELRRVARRVVVFTFDPDVHNSFWLFREYFPRSLEQRGHHPPSPEEIAEVIGGEVSVVPVPHDCVDGFGWAYWRRPAAYLDPAVRRCISGLAQLPADAVDAGVRALSRDLDNGEWRAKFRHLEALDEIDGGYRLVVGATHDR